METKAYLISKAIRILAIAFIFLMLAMKGVRDEQIKNILFLFCGFELVELIAIWFISMNPLGGKRKNE